MCWNAFAALAAGVGMLSGATAQAIEPTPATETPYAYDANGILLGQFVPGSSLILLKIEGRYFSLFAKTDMFPNQSFRLFFKSTDCSGTPFLPFGELIPHLLVTKRNVYYQSTEIQNVSPQSFKSYNISALKRCTAMPLSFGVYAKVKSQPRSELLNYVFPLQLKALGNPSTRVTP